MGAGTHLFVALLRLMVRVWQDGILAAQMGQWPAIFRHHAGGGPFERRHGADHRDHVSGVGLYSPADVDETGERNGFHPLYHVLLTGVTGSFITYDLFNLYVWFEVMLIAFLRAIGAGVGEKVQLDGGDQVRGRSIWSAP